MPDKIFGLTHILDFIDRCHSLGALHPPPAAVSSFPIAGPVISYAKILDVEAPAQAPQNPEMLPLERSRRPIYPLDDI